MGSRVCSRPSEQIHTRRWGCFCSTLKMQIDNNTSLFPVFTFVCRPRVFAVHLPCALRESLKTPVRLQSPWLVLATGFMLPFCPFT